MSFSTVAVTVVVVLLCIVVNALPIIFLLRSPVTLLWHLNVTIMTSLLLVRYHYVTVINLSATNNAEIDDGCNSKASNAAAINAAAINAAANNAVQNAAASNGVVITSVMLLLQI